MSPHKQPSSLFNICILRSLNLINECCYIIEKSYPETEFHECERQVYVLKRYLMSSLPTRLFDLLCLKRGCCQYRGDPRISLHVFTHRNMSVFRKCDIDNNISQSFLIRMLPLFTRLVVLDLKFICTDEILEVISTKCLLLEELNIISKLDICKSHINASVLSRKVSDAGLHYISNLKQLRILSMDPPRNERARRVSRCVSQAGIIMLVTQLPYLEELRIESCEIGSTLLATDLDIGPLSLKMINTHFPSPKGMRKLIKMCPHLRDLSITHLSTHDKDEILDQVAISEARLNKLNISFFSYSPSLQRLLDAQGAYLTQLSFWEVYLSMNLNALVNIGLSCPNLVTLCLVTQTNNFSIPRYFVRPKGIFTKLENLTLGNENYNIEDITLFLLECTVNLLNLTVKYQTKINASQSLKYALDKGYLKNIESLWLDCTLEVSIDIVRQIIKTCDNLTKLTVDCGEDVCEINKFILDNNLDLDLGGY